VGPTCQPAEEIKERVGQLSGPVERGRGPAEIKEKEKGREKKRRWAAGRDGPGWVGPKRKREREGEKGVVKDFSFFSKPF
jgi:hypothetical protein